MWMMLRGTSPSQDFVEWEKYPFILCDHQGLRKVICDSGAPKSVTTSGALAEVLDHLGLRRISVVTP